MVILIADDETGVRNTLSELFKGDHEVILCEDGAVALQHLEKVQVDLVIADNNMPKVTGLELLRRTKAISPTTSFMLITAFGSVEQAVEAIRLGADDYFMKPFDLSEIEHRVRRVEDLRAWHAEAELKGDKGTGVGRLIGASVSVRAAKEFIEKVSSVQSPVLLLGPSGSGKEVVARAIHESGNRASRPFVAINCASLSEQLMESELFGHEKGAFTGAVASKLGKFELAKGGTLFLDEIGELSGPLQAKLLRVLQEKEFFRVGGVKQIKADVRVIAATHRELKEMVKVGTFREDLFFRLNVLAFEWAPLSKRPEDIGPLIDFFWARISAELGKRVALSPEAKKELCAYSFPGNVRELQNLLERLMVLAPEGGAVHPESLPPEIHAPSASAATGAAAPAAALTEGKGLNDVLEEIEARLVADAMEKTGHNQVRAAELLKLTRGALQYKLKKYGLLSAA